MVSVSSARRVCDATHAVVEINERQGSEAVEYQELDRVLEAAVVLSWPELVPNRDAGLIHVEYDLDMRGDVIFLQIWLSTNGGGWRLICSYIASASGSRKNGIQFAKGYASERLAEMLDVVVNHHGMFLRPLHLGRQGLVQIATPSEKERIAAGFFINQALNLVEYR
jgi:hypothetical protein